MPLPRRIIVAVRKRTPIGRRIAPVHVIEGNFPPYLTGEGSYSTFSDGTVCHNYRAARRCGYRITYHKSTLCISVGDVWLAKELGYLEPLLDRVKLPVVPDTPQYVILDMLEERGMLSDVWTLGKKRR